MTRDDVHIHKKQTTFICRDCGDEIDKRKVSKDALKAKRCEDCWQYLRGDPKAEALDRLEW